MVCKEVIVKEPVSVSSAELAESASFAEPVSYRVFNRGKSIFQVILKEILCFSI